MNTTNKLTAGLLAQHSEQFKAITLSTNHLDPLAQTYLLHASSPFIQSKKSGEGFHLKVHSTWADSWPDMPTTLKALVGLCAEAGFMMIEFDSAAPLHSLIPCYETQA